MNKSYFSSSMSSSMNNFVIFKQNSGFDYRMQAEHLRCFDYFCVQNEIKSHILTPEIIDAYSAGLSKYAPNTRRNRMSILKKFSEYHAIFNKGSYVISKIHIQVRKPQKAYIYSDEEVAQILDGLQKYPSRDSFRNASYYMITGILAFTGARIEEVLSLKLKNWDPEKLTLFIKRGKFGKDRIIPVSQTVAEKIESYLLLRTKYAFSTPDDYLFINGKRNKIDYSCFRTVFSSVLALCGIDGKKKPFSRKPSIHSLRHTFAVRCIIRWVDEGKDVNSMLPHLSVYLGHKGIEATQIYLQSTSELMHRGADKFHRAFKNNI